MNDCTDVLLPVLTKMINISSETANVPVQLKEAMIRPKLKKESLDHEVHSNFRPISNLKFISKMIQKAVSYQLTNYLRDNDLEESLQSAYKTFHSTETALVKAYNDIVSAIDDQSYIILLLLDLAAAFDVCVACPKDLCWGLYCMYCTRPHLATLSEVTAYHVISTLMTPRFTAHSSFMIKRLQCSQLSLV